MQNKLIWVGVIFAVLLSGMAIMKSGVVERVTERVVKEGTGAVSGPEYYSRQFFNKGLTQGGRLATSSTASTYTTVSADFFGEPTYMDWTPNINTTVSISATSTRGYVPNVGDTATTYWRNASSTATATITLAAEDANTDIQHNEGGDLVLNGLDFARVTFVRESDYLVSVIFEEMTEGD